MGKKGVLLDNGRQAQSSMSLYWKKNREQQNKPKKEYEPTEEEQLNERVETGFAKWKLHKQKMINKALVGKKQKKEEEKPSKPDEEEEEQLQALKKPTGPAKIPGFKSKEQLERKLRVEQLKEVDQSGNVLQLPAHMSGITEKDIIELLRQKKAKKDFEHARKKNLEEEDVMLGEDFLASFKTETDKKKEEEENLKKQQQAELEEQRQRQQAEKHFFKTDILNQISMGNFSGLPNQNSPEQKQKNIPTIGQTGEPSTNANADAKGQKDAHKNQTNEGKDREGEGGHIAPMFRPRVLGRVVKKSPSIN